MTGSLPAGDLRLPGLLTVPEAAVVLARALGTRVSPEKVRRLAAEGALERVDLGGRVRILPASVEAYVQLQATGTTDRPLTEQQERRLVLAAAGFVSSSTERSMPSLERRGLVEKYWETHNGRRVYDWRITDAGRAEAQRIQARDAAQS